MKKIFLFLLCAILSLQCVAADIDITEDYEVQVNKNALLAALYEADIATVRKALDLKLLTCYELTVYYLERIQAFNDTFQCFITLCDDALAIAKQRDEAIKSGTAEGSLFGIPVVIKDNIDYAGYATTNGLGYGTTAKENAAVVQRLLDEGAIILGKTNMSAGAEDALRSVNDSGLETFNAYNPNLASGGSSGGSAVAVSLNFALAGLGTDTNSSLRYPSALNGCISLRTTFGLIDNSGCVPLNPSRDVVGAITRSVEDQAIMLDVLTNHEYQFAENMNANVLKGLKIGVLKELAYPLEGDSTRRSSVIDPEIQEAFAKAIDELKSCGAEIITVSMPNIFEYLTVPYTLNQKLEKLLSQNDVSAIIYPAYLHTPHYTTQEYLNGESIYDLPYSSNCNTLSSRTGAPEITVPIGQHSSGAGIAMEIISYKNNDQLLLDIAYNYTLQYDHRQAPDDAPNLHFGDSEVSLEEFLNLYHQKLIEAEKLKKQSPDEQKETIPTEEYTNDIMDSPVESEEKETENNNPLIGLLVFCLMGGVICFVYKRKTSNVS